MASVPATHWRWELTPREILSSFRFIQSSSTKDMGLEVMPFRCAKRPLEGTPYTYQLAVSDRSVCHEIKIVRAAQPEMPTSGDRRSGVIVFQGDTIVGALIIKGQMVSQGYSLFVRPDLRQQGLAFRMLVEWLDQTKRPFGLPEQRITLHSAKACLAAHRVIVERAVAAGLPVPERVLAGIQNGEADEIIAQATRVENAVLPTDRKERHRLYRTRSNAVVGGQHG